MANNTREKFSFEVPFPRTRAMNIAWEIQNLRFLTNSLVARIANPKSQPLTHLKKNPSSFKPKKGKSKEELNLRGVRIGAATGDETQWIDEPEVCAVWCSVVQGGVWCGAGWCRVLQRGTEPSALVKLRCVLCVAVRCRVF